MRVASWHLQMTDFVTLTILFNECISSLKINTFFLEGSEYLVYKPCGNGFGQHSLYQTCLHEGGTLVIAQKNLYSNVACKRAFPCERKVSSCWSCENLTKSKHRRGSCGVSEARMRKKIFRLIKVLSLQHGRI